ncbi:MAG: DegT/DnrJ/EryC1/StrS family aminotransferase [Candidatus Thorarchaeota archaeon]|jgi:dTDP-4-amino-4,6-dideoxygalactose transaminase
MNPYNIVDEFEKSIADYSGSKYAIAVDNCTNAIFLCCKYLNAKEITIPSKTYMSVPCAIINSGCRVKFENKDWSGCYYLDPYPIVDGANRFSRNMYIKDSYHCISFSGNKPIKIGKGGMILTNDSKANEWFRLARYMGRNPVNHKKDTYQMVGWNMYMTPEQAARGLSLMLNVNDSYDNIKSDYQDLSSYEIYTKANR